MTNTKQVATAAIPASATKGGVAVLKRENVAGYDAAVLKAGDAKSLRDWLSTNGFPAPEWMERWVAPYLAKGWPIAAFRVLKDEFPRPVRTTFATETPFAPYAVPPENGSGGATSGSSW